MRTWKVVDNVGRWSGKKLMDVIYSQPLIAKISNYFVWHSAVLTTEKKWFQGEIKHCFHSVELSSTRSW